MTRHEKMQSSMAALILVCCYGYLHPGNQVCTGNSYIVLNSPKLMR